MIPLSPRQIAAAVGVLLVAAVLAVGFFKVRHVLAQAERVPALEAQVRAARADAEAVRASWAKSEKLAGEYETNLSAIRAQFDELRSRPARVVRVCNDAAPVPAAAGAGGADAAEPATDSGPQAPGRDIGRPLYGVADASDEREAELDAKVEGLQRFIAEQCAAPAAPE